MGLLPRSVVVGLRVLDHRVAFHEKPCFSLQLFPLRDWGLAASTMHLAGPVYVEPQSQ
jgi:hypothetical protein